MLATSSGCSLGAVGRVHKGSWRERGESLRSIRYQWAGALRSDGAEHARCLADPELTVLRQQIIPAVQQAPGFVGGYFLAAVDGVGLAVVVFETEETARAAAGAMGVHPGGSVAPGTSIETVEFTEVLGVG